MSFMIKKLANGKWRLFRDDNDVCDFDSLEEAKAGMEILVHPEEHYFDGQGRETKERKNRQ